METVLRSVLVPICVVAGAAVVSVFFFPGVVGSLLPGRAILVVSLLFFGSGLAYVALLPITVDASAEEARRDAPYLLRIRRLGWIRSKYGASRRASSALEIGRAHV